jgi:short subunit dehydrogenase-like uncharacterized protein
MSRSPFMIYGAYGYTGELIARRAVARGHRPVLAGRDAHKLERLARELGLVSVPLALDDPAALARELGRVELVCHTAGPFVHTAEPMLAACLAAGTHYVDITGELPVFQRIFAAHEEAQRRGVALLSGAGFDVVPSDCLARFVADLVPGANELTIAFAALGRPSAGTAKASFEGILRGNYRRVGGVLEEIPLGEGVREVQFSDRRRTVLPIPWGDLETAYRTTAIPNITTYMAIPSTAARLLGRASPITSRLWPKLTSVLSRPAIRETLLSVIEKNVTNPGEEERASGRAYLWARASAADGRSREAWLETSDGYTFTAESAVLVMERLVASRPSGALTPAAAFGADFVLEVGGSKRHEQLPASARG